MEEKKLRKSSDNRILCGVCGGVAEYFNADPTLVRILWAAFSLAGGTGIALYVVAAIIMPSE